MIDTSTIERYMRDANPVPHVDDLDPDEFAGFVAIATSRRAAIMQAPTQHPITPPTSPSPVRRKAWAFAVAFILILASIGIAALFLRGEGGPVIDEPVPPTTIPETRGESISFESLTWTRAPLDPSVFSSGGVGDYYPVVVEDIVAGGPGFVAVGFIGGGPDPNDTPPPNNSDSWMPGRVEYRTVWTSPDGYTWSRVPYDEAAFGVDSEIKAVTASGPGLVAVGDQDVWLSTDGYEWSRIPRDPAVFDPIFSDLRGVVAGGPGFVAYGEWNGTSEIWTSPDGYAWTQVPDSKAVFGRSAIHSITQGGPGLVAIGVDETGWPDRQVAVVWTSPDGYTWTRVPHDPSVFGEGTSMVDVAAGTSGLVAVGVQLDEEYSMYAAVWTSPDGINWTRVPHDEATFVGPHWDMSSVIAVGDGFVALGSWAEENLWTSPDGTNWTRIPDPEAIFGENTYVDKLIAGGPGFVALGGASEEVAIWVAAPPNTDGAP